MQVQQIAAWYIISVHGNAAGQIGASNSPARVSTHTVPVNFFRKRAWHVLH